MGYQKRQDLIRFLKPIYSPYTLNRNIICLCGLVQMAWGPKVSFTLKTRNGLLNKSLLFCIQKSYIFRKNASISLYCLLPLAPQSQLKFEIQLDYSSSFGPPLQRVKYPFICSSFLFHPLWPSQKEHLKTIVHNCSSTDGFKTTCNFILPLGTGHCLNSFIAFIGDVQFHSSIATAQDEYEECEY